MVQQLWRHAGSQHHRLQSGGGDEEGEQCPVASAGKIGITWLAGVFVVTLHLIVYVGAQGVEGTGLAFIAFTEVMALFPASPFWSALFFLMLLNLGMSTMFGTMQGILTPLMDNFPLLGRHRTLLTGRPVESNANLAYFGTPASQCFFFVFF